MKIKPNYDYQVNSEVIALASGVFEDVNNHLRILDKPEDFDLLLEYINAHITSDQNVEDFINEIPRKIESREEAAAEGEDEKVQDAIIAGKYYSVLKNYLKDESQRKVIIKYVEILTDKNMEMISQIASREPSIKHGWHHFLPSIKANLFTSFKAKYVSD